MVSTILFSSGSSGLEAEAETETGAMPRTEVVRLVHAGGGKVEEKEAVSEADEEEAGGNAL